MAFQLRFDLTSPARIHTWRVKEGAFVKRGHVIMEFMIQQDDGTVSTPVKFKAAEPGVVRGILVKKGDVVANGTPLLILEPCTHPTVIEDMCGKCGADLAKLDIKPQSTTDPSSYVSMIHAVPGLKVSLKDAKSIDKNEEGHLLQRRQLRLLVDLDQTIIHTTNDNVPKNLKDVVHFQLWGHGSVWYHTRLRPNTRVFLERISKLYQLHICTFGSRNYAHQIAKILDPAAKYFFNRILSRDECFSQNSKTANLKDLFPNGDHMVCIIDDREDVWNYGPNLIHVKPYHFFRHTGDINAPPGFTKKDDDDKVGFDFTKANSKLKEDKSTPKSKSVVKEKPDSNTAIEGKQATQALPAVTLAKKDLTNVTDDLLLSDEDEEDESEERANDAGSESSSNDEEPTTESDTDPSLKQAKSEGQSESPSSLSETPAEETTKEDILTELEAKKETTIELASVTQAQDIKLAEDLPKSAIAEAENLQNPTSVSDSPVKEAKEDGEISDASLVLTEGTSSLVVASGPDPPVVDSLKNDEIEVEDEDDYLFFLEDILKQIHEAFYKLYDEMKEKGNGDVPDVKNVIPYVRRKVLKGCSIVFSGVVPVGHKLEKSRPYKVAQSLGAQVSDKIIPPRKNSVPSSSVKEILPTTHVVAARLGTAKVNDARRYKGVHIVTPNWLWCCAERWDRVEEKLFALCKKSDVRRHPPAHCSSPESTLSQSRDDFDLITPLESQDSDDAVFSSQSGSVTPKNGKIPAGRRGRTPSGRFMDTINPLMSFSMDDIESMGQEVDDICNESDESDSSSTSEESAVVRKKPSKVSHVSHVAKNDQSISQQISSSSSDSSDDGSNSRPGGLISRKRRRESKTETETEDEPLNARFRRGEPLPSDVDMLNLTNASSDEEEGDDQEENLWMARALEKELLGDDESNDIESSKSQDGY